MFIVSILLTAVSTLSLTGRILDEARGIPVEGAIITRVNGPQADTTGSDGIFYLFSSTSLNNEGFPVNEVNLLGQMLVVRSAESDIRLRAYSNSGARLGDQNSFSDDGEHRFDLNPFFKNYSHAHVSFLRLKTDDGMYTFRMVSLAPDRALLVPLHRVLPPRPVKKYGAPGQLQIAREGLVTATVEYVTESDDLGDIVLLYPERTVGLGVSPIYAALPLYDGTRASLDTHWQMWQSEWRIKNGLEATPVTWQLENDIVDQGQVMVTPLSHDPKWYARDEIVTVNEYRDFQLHLEFNVSEGGNSGVYLQNRYELQVTDGGRVGDVYNEVTKTSDEYAGTDKWNAYDVTFRAARWNGNTRTEKANLSVWFNGVQVHKNVEADTTHGKDFEGEGGENYVSGGEPVDSTDKGLKLQNHGTTVRYRNIWILPLDITEPDTDFGY